MEKKNVHLIKGKYTFKQRLRALEPKVIASGALKNIQWEHPEFQELIKGQVIKPGHSHYIITRD